MGRVKRATSNHLSIRWIIRRNFQLTEIFVAKKLNAINRLCLVWHAATYCLNQANTIYVAMVPTKKIDRISSDFKEARSSVPLPQKRTSCTYTTPFLSRLTPVASSRLHTCTSLRLAPRRALQLCLALFSQT